MLSIGFIVWKSASPESDWMAEHLAEFLGSVASAVALGFIAYAASIQARQARSQELLTSFQLSRPDLGGLARRIAMTARLVVDERKGGAPGKLTEYQAAYELGDHAVFAYLISSPKRIQAALAGSDGEQLRHQTLRYIRLFDSVTALTQERELERMLLRLPLGRAYCTLKIAIGEDGDGRLANCLAFDAEPELGRP
ncbi:hypothetical protein DDF67_10740 [Caulobacter endophyticus]|uniref:Uncharacterized protein n=2 Tax=Caulobacter endophyticus TaxID=2172652 RepID=A0A2T9K259_9CAUL|nr:hypothetical protein DDF67_10740 [Caulobacter endophyticus]